LKRRDFWSTSRSILALSNGEKLFEKSCTKNSIGQNVKKKVEVIRITPFEIIRIIPAEIARAYFPMFLHTFLGFYIKKTPRDSPKRLLWDFIRKDPILFSIKVKKTFPMIMYHKRCLIVEIILKVVPSSRFI
jgi:hypothetical protein